jgi:hypothetical protein
METAMRRTRPALIAFFILALASLPVAARTAQLSGAKNAAPAARGNGTAPVRAPRWHRFLPGMFR